MIDPLQSVISPLAGEDPCQTAPEVAEKRTEGVFLQMIDSIIEFREARTQPEEVSLLSKTKEEKKVEMLQTLRPILEYGTGISCVIAASAGMVLIVLGPMISSFLIILKILLPIGALAAVIFITLGVLRKECNACLEAEECRIRQQPQAPDSIRRFLSLEEYEDLIGLREKELQDESAAYQGIIDLAAELEAKKYEGRADMKKVSKREAELSPEQISLATAYKLRALHRLQSLRQSGIEWTCREISKEEEQSLEEIRKKKSAVPADSDPAALAACYSRIQE